MRFRDIWRIRDGWVAFIEGTDTIHTAILYDDWDVFCSCIGYQVHRVPCKHLKEFHFQIDGWQAPASGDVMKVESELTAIQGLTYYKSQQFIFLSGDQGAGKSTFAIQEGAAIAKKINKNILYLRTEKGDFEEETAALAAQYGAKVIYHRIPSYSTKQLDSETDAILYNVVRFFGEEAVITRAEDGMTVRFGIAANPLVSEKVTDDKGEYVLDGNGKPKTHKVRKYVNEAEKIIKENDIGVLIVDSFSEPLKAVFGSGERENLPNRASAINHWAAIMLRLTEKHDLFTFIINHTAGIQPDMGKIVKQKAYGSASMGFKSEISLLLAMFQGEQTHGIVRFTEVRAPGKEQWQHEGFLRLVEGVGFRDVTDKELKEVSK